MDKPSGIMSGKVCMVTGSNSGIGKVTARELARMGAIVIMVCRSRDRGERARKEIISDTGNESVELMMADLSSLQAVRELAADLKERLARLHVLVNNAALWPTKRS
ncbi:MAG: SDR family NAD(P)-dependent oxidoreductase, partial [Thermoplasmata archaeon]